MTAPQLLSGLSDLAPAYDALICDVWGVLHNGHAVFPDAAAALARFRAERGPVILLTNAPRLPREVLQQFGFARPLSTGISAKASVQCELFRHGLTAKLCARRATLSAARAHRY